MEKDNINRQLALLSDKVVENGITYIDLNHNYKDAIMVRVLQNVKDRIVAERTYKPFSKYAGIPKTDALSNKIA